MRTVIASSFGFKIDGKAERSGQWKAPGRGVQTGALAFPGDWRGRWGNATGHYKRRGSAIQPMPNQAKGRRKAGPSAPLAPLPKCPHTRKEMSKNLTMKLRLGWGAEGAVAFTSIPGGVPKPLTLTPSGDKTLARRTTRQGLFLRQRNWA
jgi:hypothetical protein